MILPGSLLGKKRNDGKGQQTYLGLGLPLPLLTNPQTRRHSEEFPRTHSGGPGGTPRSEPVDVIVVTTVVGQENVVEGGVVGLASRSSLRRRRVVPRGRPFRTSRDDLVVGDFYSREEETVHHRSWGTEEKLRRPYRSRTV